MIPFTNIHVKLFSSNRRCFSFMLWLFIHIRPHSVQARSSSGFSPEEGLVIQHTGQFMVEGLVKCPQEVSGDWKHWTQVPVCHPPSVGHGTFGQCCFYLLWYRTCREDDRLVSDIQEKPSRQKCCRNFFMFLWLHFLIVCYDNTVLNVPSSSPPLNVKLSSDDSCECVMTHIVER